MAISSQSCLQKFRGTSVGSLILFRTDISGDIYGYYYLTDRKKNRLVCEENVKEVKEGKWTGGGITIMSGLE
jgi:hypothetical protein